MLERYDKVEAATQQLRTAIALYVGKKDRVSAITLAGAADSILSPMVRLEGKQNFAEYMRKEAEADTGIVMTEADVGRGLNDTLKINALKHLNDDEDEYLDLDPDESGLGAILKACVNFNHLRGRRADPIVDAFLTLVQAKGPDWLIAGGGLDGFKEVPGRALA